MNPTTVSIIIIVICVAYTVFVGFGLRHVHKDIDEKDKLIDDLNASLWNIRRESERKSLEIRDLKNKLYRNSRRHRRS